MFDPGRQQQQQQKRRRPFGRLRGDARGATAVEYGLIVSIIVIGMLASFIEVSKVTRDMWNNVSSQVTNAH